MEEHKTYSIGTVARKVGVPKYKLRHWCDRYLPEIQKIDIGDMQHRRFTDRDIELIKRSRRIGTGVSPLRRPSVRPEKIWTAGRNRKVNPATDSTQRQKEV
jgi:hypothetical protein